jgi:hypothetical protein
MLPGVALLLNPPPSLPSYPVRRTTPFARRQVKPALNASAIALSNRFAGAETYAVSFRRPCTQHSSDGVGLGMTFAGQPG